MKRSLVVVLGIALVVAVAAGSFYGGMVYGKKQAQASFSGPPGGDGTFVRRGFVSSDTGGAVMIDEGGAFPGRQGGMAFGEIQTISGNDVTLKDESGKEIVVHVTETTLIQKQADVTVADLAEGETVIVSGSRGEDGSITARMVQVAPGGGMGFAMPRIEVMGTPQAPGGTEP